MTARLTYSSSSNNTLEPATIFDPDYPPFEELDIVPLEVEAMDYATVSHRLDAAFATYDDGNNRASCTLYIPESGPRAALTISSSLGGCSQQHVRASP